MASAAQEVLPELVTEVPGPRSRALARRLQRVECPDTTYISDDFPVFWERASAANVWDVDGNRYVDLTAAFGVCTLGHAHPEVSEAMRQQTGRVVHAMGDVHPAALKVRLAERLSEIAPQEVEVCLFGSSGSDAVEAALKTTTVATGRPGVLAFEGAYHGLGYGALSVTWRDGFRRGFLAQLNPHVQHVPFPDPYRRGLGGRDAADEAARVLERVDARLAGSAGDRLGGVIVEPILGRGGVTVPHPSFLRGLREICTRRDRLLILDEILTGLGRTGRWFACEHAGVTPDLLCLGKSLAGGLPLSVCMGRAAVMRSWGRSRGEARHTSTFLGNPLACAAALATLDVLQRDGWPRRVAELGREFAAGLAELGGIPGVADVRGLGLMWGIELEASRGVPDAARTFTVVRDGLRRGSILVGAGSSAGTASRTVRINATQIIFMHGVP
ncbi:MAG: aspartate aminotransferase family protein [Candidatus Krumholzibacteriia bacterium]